MNAHSKLVHQHHCLGFVEIAVAPESQTVHGETEAMPILRLMITATILSTALAQGLATAAGPVASHLLGRGHAGGAMGGGAMGGGAMGGGEYVVSSQVVSDQAVGTGTSFVGDVSSGSIVGDAAVGGIPRTYGYPDLFYNNYTQGRSNLTNAQMYVSPVPTPPFIGHTFITYQPFMPEEMLYWHTNRYHNYYDGGRGMNHTKVHYYGPPVRTGVSNLYWSHLRIPR
jgi:hypothetical protein